MRGNPVYWDTMLLFFFLTGFALIWQELNPWVYSFRRSYLHISRPLKLYADKYRRIFSHNLFQCYKTVF